MTNRDELKLAISVFDDITRRSLSGEYVVLHDDHGACNVYDKATWLLAIAAANKYVDDGAYDDFEDTYAAFDDIYALITNNDSVFHFCGYDSTYNKKVLAEMPYNEAVSISNILGYDDEPSPGDAFLESCGFDTEEY